MKNKLILIFFLSFFLGFSQQKRFDVNWQGTKLLKTGVSKIEVPAFDSEHFNFDEINGLTFFAQWDISNTIDEKSAQITDISFQVITRNDLKDLSLELLPNAPRVTLRNLKDRNKCFVYI